MFSRNWNYDQKSDEHIHPNAPVSFAIRILRHLRYTHVQINT